MEKLKPKAVIFDLGSTLIEYESIPYPELGAIASISVWKFLTKADYNVPEEQEFIDVFENVKEEFRKPAREDLTEWTVPEAVGKLLDRLKIEPQDGLVDKIFAAYYKPVAEQI